MNPIFRYSLMRFLVLAAVLIVLYLFNLRGVTLIATSLVVSLLLSYIVLKPFRDAATASIAAKIERRIADKNPEAVADEDVEDAAVDSVGDAPQRSENTDSAAPGSSDK